MLLQAHWDRTSLFVIAAIPAFVAAVSALVLSLTTGDIKADRETALLAH